MTLMAIVRPPHVVLDVIQHVHVALASLKLERFRFDRVPLSTIIQTTLCNTKSHAEGVIPVWESLFN